MNQQQHLSAAAVSAALGGRPCESTCQDIINEYNQTGSTSKQGRTGITHTVRKLDSVALQYLIELVSEQPGSLLHELAASVSQLTGVAFAEHDVWRGLHEIGFTYSKVTQRAAEANLQDQHQFKQVIENLCVGPRQLLFMDEVATDSRVVNRQYAWALKGLKTFSEGLFVRGNRFSTVAAMSADGIVGEPLIVPGSVTQDMYTAHFASEVFFKIKAYLRAERTWVETVPPVVAIKEAFATITAANCEAWIRGVDCYDTAH